MTDTTEPTGTSWWVVFASAALVIGSFSNFATGLTFVLNTDWALATTEFTDETAVKAIGWINLGIGTLMLASAWGVFAAKTWARAVGVIFGVLTMLNGVTNLQLNPVWGLAGVAVGIAIVYALMVKATVVVEAKMDEPSAIVPDIPSERMAQEAEQYEDL